MKVLNGAGDLVGQLEDALARAKSGELQGVVICGITQEGCGWVGSYVGGIEFPWPRLLASVETARFELTQEGLVDWV